MKVAAVIVTYNRKELLLECVNAVLGQHEYVPDIVIVDNASSDGTREALQSYIDCGAVLYFNTGANLGGAGGFQYGIRKAAELEYDYLWVMDDDCIPSETALPSLLAFARKKPDIGFLTSKVLWKDGSICEMNVQRRTLTRDVKDFSGACIPVVMASFVSLLLPSSVVKELGLPIKEFFLWTDDWEYTRRISRHYPCYLITDSVVTHKSKANIGADISNETLDRLDRFNYLYRNDVVLYRREGLKGFAYEAVRLSGHIVRVLLKAKDHKWKRICKIIGGTFAGLRFHPAIEYVEKIGAPGADYKENSGKIRVLEAFGEPIADGGQEAFVFGVMEKMDMTGLNIDCLTAYDCRSEHYKTLVKKLGGKVYALNLPFAPGKSRENIRKPFAEFMRRHHYDVVHIHSGSISVLAIMASVADKAGVKKVIVHSHASGDKDNIKHKILRLMASLSMRRHVDVYCACSREAADWKFARKYADRAVIIKNGIDTERFAYRPKKRLEMRSKLGLEQSFVVGHVGRFTKEKNHEFLVSAFNSIIQSEPEARLLLVGTGEEMNRIRELVKVYRFEDKVIFTGTVTNVQDYLQAMDVFVLPSRYEGLGIVAIEAQCCGLPVVASDTVPKEINLTGSVTHINLKESPAHWSEEIIFSGQHERISQGEIVAGKGYDLQQTAARVRDLYVR